MTFWLNVNVFKCNHSMFIHIADLLPPHTFRHINAQNSKVYDNVTDTVKRSLLLLR